MLELSFRVRLTAVSASQLNCPGRTPTAVPFYRLDFDGKMIQSSFCDASGDPSWSQKSAFEYRLSEATVESAMISLTQRSATLAIYFAERDGTKEVCAGMTTVDLYTVATGAAAFAMDLRRPDSHNISCGRVSFTLAMEQQTIVAVSFPTLTVAGLPKPTATQLRYHFISDPAHIQESTISPVATDPSWTNTAKILIRTTLRGLLENTLRVMVCDVVDNGTVMAHFDVTLAEHITSNATHTVKVSRNAYAETNYKVNFTALASGTIEFADLPIFAQFASGSNTNGSVFGKPMLAGCPLPPRYSKHGAAARLPAHHAPPHAPTMTSPTKKDPIPIAAALAPNVTLPREAYLPPHDEPTNRSIYNRSAVEDDHRPKTPLAQSYQFSYSAAPAQIQAAPAAAPVVQHPHHDIIPQGSRHAKAIAEVEQEGDRYFEQVSRIEGHQSHVQERSPLPPLRGAPPLRPTSAPKHHTSMPLAPAPVVQQPSMSTVYPRSPMSSLGAVLQRQYEEAVRNIRQQQQQVTAMLEELQERTEREEKSTAAHLEAMTAEEIRARDQLKIVEQTIREYTIAEESLEIEVTENAKQFNTHRTGLELELQELVEVEAQLQTLQRSILNHADEQARARERARREAEDARRRVEQDGRLFGELEHRMVTRPVSPYRARPDPTIGGGQPIPAPSNTTVHHQTHNAPLTSSSACPQEGRLGPNGREKSVMNASNTAPAALGGGGTYSQMSHFQPAAGRADHGLLVAVKASSAQEFHAIMRDFPQSIYVDHSILHHACAARSPSVDIVASILQHRPELLHAVDNNTGNTPLHFACSAESPSLAVVELLLARGANPYALNREGLSPYHLSLLNADDHAEKLLRKHFIFKVGVDINFPSGAGETPAHLVSISDRYFPSLEFLHHHGAHLDHVAQVRDGSNNPVLMTPLQKAKMYGTAAKKIVQFLESH